MSQSWLILVNTLYESTKYSGLTPALGSKETTVVKMKVGSALSTVLSLTGTPVCIIRVNQAVVLPPGNSKSMLSEGQLHSMVMHVQKQ